MKITQQLLLQFVLILINAFFAATEIAVISLNENKLRKQVKDGDKKSEKLLAMVTESAGFLSTIQIGITLAGFLGSAFAADNFSDMLTEFITVRCGFTLLSADVINTLSVVIITIILSYFTLVLGELVPKRIAMKKSEKLARGVCGFITALSKILSPFVWLLSKSTNGVLRLLGFNPHDEEAPVSEDEIKMMIDLGEENGTIKTGEKEMIENIFEFNNHTAVEIMTHRTDMAVIWEEDSPEDIVELISESGFSRFPVCGESIDDVKGIVRTREYLLNMRSEHPLPLSELLKPPYCVPETVRADILFRDMQAKKFHMAIVVDEYGGTSGVIT
ncbi:MAG: hemolysin family protein, partial [Eubacteriales bacterium]